MKRLFLYHPTLCILASMLLLTANATWGGPHEDREARLAARYGLEKPEGNGPFPAVMLVPGCAGFERPLWKGHYIRTVQHLKEMGFVTIKVDYLAAGETSNCELIMNPAEVADDVATAAKYLRAQPFVKPDAINLLGWSYGGGGVLNSLTRTEYREPVPVAAVVAYYPYLALARPWNVDVPVLVLCSAQDITAPCDRVETLLTEVPSKDRVQMVKYSEGYHGFDNADLPDKMLSSNERPMGYKEATATAAWVEVAKFLRR